MRFLILSQYFPPETGAPPIRLASMIRELLKLGHTVEVVTAMPNYPTGKIFPNYQKHFYQLDNWEGIPVHRVWMYAAKGAGIKRLLNYFSFTLIASFGLKKAQKPDYLFVESPPLFLGITGYLAAKLWKVPLIFNVADLWPDTISALGLISEGLVLKLARRLEMWLYDKARYITVVTSGVQQILIEKKRVPANKILLLPNGVDTKLFGKSQFKFAIDLPKDKTLILYAGTHGYAHGMEVVLQAAKLLVDTNVLFLCIGGGSDKQRIMQLSKDMKLNNVIFWDSQPPEFIANLYDLAFAGIATFRDSPLLECTRPAKTLPILASGKPILFSGAGEGAKLVIDSQAGIVTAPGDYNGLAKSVRKLINHPRYTIQLGLNGRKYAEQNLDWSIIVTDWLKQLNLEESKISSA